MKFEKITIIGTGFMGGCLAKAIKRKKIAKSVWGLARNKKREKQIKRLNIFDKLSVDLNEALKESSLVILATPISLITEYIKKISPLLEKESIVTDIGSTKQEIIRLARRYLKNKFVGSHPLCGSEKKGAQASVSNLFKDSLCIVTPIKKNKALETVKDFWKDLGCKITVLDEVTHDCIIAYASGLPHLLSFSLTRTFPLRYSRFIAGSFRDLTRVSASEGLLWADIFLSNKTFLKRCVKELLKNIELLLNLIDRKDKSKLTCLLKSINQKHRNLFSSK